MAGYLEICWAKGAMPRLRRPFTQKRSNEPPSKLSKSKGWGGYLMETPMSKKYCSITGGIPLTAIFRSWKSSETSNIQISFTSSTSNTTPRRRKSISVCFAFLVPFQQLSFQSWNIALLHFKIYSTLRLTRNCLSTKLIVILYKFGSHNHHSSSTKIFSW